MFTFLHPYQKIRRLEQEVASLRAQLDAATTSPSCRLLNLMKPVPSISMLQARGADMLASLNTGIEEYADQLAGESATLAETFTLIAAAEQAVDTLHQRLQTNQHTEDPPTSPLVLAKTLHALSQLQVALARNAGHAQTLAVNAALETAQSQESPGLTTIAEDVHRLALNMHQLSHQLSLLMEKINSQVREHSQALVKTRQAEDELAHFAKMARYSVQQLSDQTRHMHKIIHHSATAAFLHSAKLDHAVWKCRLYKQLLSANPETLLEDDHQCRLGRWHLQGEGYQRYARTDAYRALTAPHRLMHQRGAEALKFAREGNQSGQLAALNEMEDASQQLARKLDALMEHAIYEAPSPSGSHSPLADAP